MLKYKQQEGNSDRHFSRVSGRGQGYRGGGLGSANQQGFRGRGNYRPNRSLKEILYVECADRSILPYLGCIETSLEPIGIP